MITTLPFEQTGDWREASNESEDPYACGFPYHSMWFRFTPATDMRVMATVDGDWFAVEMALFRDTPGGLVSATFPNCVKTIATDLTAGTTYYFMVVVTDKPEPYAPVPFSLFQLSAPTNDDMNAATPLTTLPYSDAANALTATSAGDDPTSCGFTPSRTTWYSFTAPVRQGVAIRVVGSSADIAVFRGTRGSLTAVACGKAATAFGRKAFVAEPGVKYWILIGGATDRIVRITQSPMPTKLSLTIRSSKHPKSYPSGVKYGEPIRLTTQLTGAAADMTNRTVSIYAVPRHGVKTLIAAGDVNADGKFTTTYRVQKKSILWAEYTGETRYAAAKSSRFRLDVRAKPTVTVSGNYYRRSGEFKLFHEGRDVRITGKVAPNHGGKSVKWELSYRRGGSWHYAVTRSFRLGVNSTVAVRFIQAPSGFDFRTRYTFAGDLDHPGKVSSPWAYFRITK